MARFEVTRERYGTGLTAASRAALTFAPGEINHRAPRINLALTSRNRRKSLEIQVLQPPQ